MGLLIAREAKARGTRQVFAERACHCHGWSGGDDDLATVRRAQDNRSTQRKGDGMAALEELTRGATVRGIVPDEVVTVVDVAWYGSSCIELTYKDAAGRLGSELLYRDREPALEIVTTGRPWSFDGDGKLLRLVSEAYRIR